jgi:alanine dehydrogenase
MIVGVPKEILDSENRVAATPAVVRELCKHGHQVLVETGAGLGSGITDQEYVAAGAEITDAAGAWTGDLILKVKEPLPREYVYFQPGKMLFTYLHLAAAAELTQELMRTGMLAIGYETVQLSNGLLPLLVPMSEVAGRMAVQIGARYLEKAEGGCGVLLGGVPGVPPAEVVIIGGGAVGSNAARIALGLGAHVSILDRNVARLRYLTEVFPGNLTTIMSNTYNIERAVADADLLIGAVLIPGARTPRLVDEHMVASMKPGSVIVDVAVDQGGCIETIDHVTTHSDPIYIKHQVIHYAVGNMPGAVPRTATFALTNATHPYVMALADRGIAAIKADPALAKGVNTINGAIVCQGVADAHNLPCMPLEEALK